MDDFEDYEAKRQSAQGMADLLSAFNDIEEGKPLTKKLPNGEVLLDNGKQVMTEMNVDLLRDLNQLGIGYGNLTGEVLGEGIEQVKNYDEYTEDGEYTQRIANSYDDDELSSIYGYYEPKENENFVPSTDYIPRQKVQSKKVQNAIQGNKSTPTYISGKNWSITESEVLGMKSAKSYSVKCNRTGQVLFDNLMLAESAIALMKLLNDGRSLSDPKILGIISSGLQYTSVVNEAIKAAKKRQAVLKESKYDDAKELDNVIAEHKKRANELRYKVLAFLKDEGFISDSKSNN